MLFCLEHQVMALQKCIYWPVAFLYGTAPQACRSLRCQSKSGSHSSKTSLAMPSSSTDGLRLETGVKELMRKVKDNLHTLPTQCVEWHTQTWGRSPHPSPHTSHHGHAKSAAAVHHLNKHLHTCGLCPVRRWIIVWHCLRQTLTSRRQPKRSISAKLRQ